MELYQLDMDEAQRQQQQQQSDGEEDENCQNQVVIPTWTFVDAAQSVEQVQNSVWAAVQETIRRVREQNKPVGKMFAPGTLQLPTATTTTAAVVNEGVGSAGTDEALLSAKGSDVENNEPSTGRDTTTNTKEAK
jgi:hypothetical protein